MASVASSVVFPPLSGLYKQEGCITEAVVVCTLTKETLFCYSLPNLLLTFGVVELKRLEVASFKNFQPQTWTGRHHIDTVIRQPGSRCLNSCSLLNFLFFFFISSYLKQLEWKQNVSSV